MELPNIHFKDFPIEFKEINPVDFKLESSFPIASDGFTIENKEKIIIEGNKKGYINDALQPLIKLEQKNTVVVNASVGSGKSFAIIQTIKRYYESSDNYLIIVATPFVSLVEQYVNDIHKDAKIPQDQIYNYADLGRKNDINYLDKKVQVITVNSLLGNPGEDGFKNSEIKRQYLNSLIENCKKNNIKVVFVYDEIHDAIQNFKEEFIFNLWKWKDVIVKNFIISATFNEASKVVIEYLAELTDRRIQLIESDRIRRPEKQSNLYLHYSSEQNFSSTTKELVSVVNDLLAREKSIDVLCYSKALAKSIIDDDYLGQKLKDRFGEINDCTSELVSNQRTENEAPKNRYDNDKCNVGTNFKTGVSIKKKNHAFVIVIPPRATRLWFRNKSGIFSDGINSIIQALARQREKGEIHIILPRPDRFDYTSLSIAGFSKKQINAFSKAYDLIKYYREEENVKYFPLNIQELLIKVFYMDHLEGNVVDEIEHLKGLGRGGFTRLQFPPYNIFKLNRGEEYLANTFKFFGEDISAYVTYCAFTNQFINCNLTGVTYKTAMFFEEGKIQKNLNDYFDRYFGEDYYNSRMDWSNFNMAYSKFREELFQNFDLRFKKEGKDWVKISPYNNKQFEIQLIRFVALKYYGARYHNKVELENKLVDNSYSRADYFSDCISVSNNINLNDVDYTDSFKCKIKAYQNLDYFRRKVISNTEDYSRAGKEYVYLPNKPFAGFLEADEVEKFDFIVTSLLEHDDFIKNNIFEFRRRLDFSKSLKSRVESFYNILLEDFFVIPTLEEYPKVTIRGKRQNVKPINSICILPQSDNVIDTIKPEKHHYPEREVSSWVNQNYSNYESYQEMISDLLQKVNK